VEKRREKRKREEYTATDSPNIAEREKMEKRVKGKGGKAASNSMLYLPRKERKRQKPEEKGKERRPAVLPPSPLPGGGGERRKVEEREGTLLVYHLLLLPRELTVRGRKEKKKKKKIRGSVFQTFTITGESKEKGEIELPLHRNGKREEGGKKKGQAVSTSPSPPVGKGPEIKKRREKEILDASPIAPVERKKRG